MKEIREILKEAASLPDGEQAVLATVVDLKGSGYRLPGARMLIKANGDTTGTVSGGCLEADVMERAKRVLETGRAEVFTYDTTADENSVFSLNMGCRGILRILLEAVDRNSPIIESLRHSYEKREGVVCAVVIGVSEGGTLNVGDRYFAGGTGLEAAPPGLSADLLTMATSSSGYQTIRYETEGGFAEFAFEQIRPPVLLLILGAGADAVPLASAACGLGWQVKCFDHRPAFLNRERLPEPEELILTERDSAPHLDADELTAIVSMNHNYDRDRAMLPAALRSAAFYVGALGPKKRTQQILDELEAPFTEDELARLYAPAGLDIGGDTPEAIAVSISAEIQSVLKHRGGGPLRDRQAPIYDRK